VPRPFDTELPADELATGFVVDAERGYILTNRHVANPGPATIEAVFEDHEEVPARVVYRDPVHDFGILRYDPNDVEFMTPVALALAPDHAKVGTEIRVVGNDAGEKLAILAGTLARLDREAPDYGRGRYSDFNTFYYQAASGTSGGSSGSPVIDIHGHAIGLNAGGRRFASSSYYLPLEPVVRALDRIRAGEPVLRGTLQAVFSFRPYDEIARLGLRPATEAAVRRADPSAIGMLVVQEIVPGGPSADRLEVGDVLVRVNGELMTRFGPLGVMLDENVGRELALSVERGGEPKTVAVRVQDLHAITPLEYLEMSGAVLHPLSFQQARNYGVPVGGVYLAAAGYMFARAGVKRGVVLTAVDGEPVQTLAEFEDRMASFAQGAKVPVRYFDLDSLKTEQVAVVSVDRLWFPMQHCAWDPDTGGWPCRPSAPPPPPEPPTVSTTHFEHHEERPLRDLEPSFVMVDVDIPYRVDGLHGDRFQGAGIVVDAEAGLVVVDRETVPVALGDVNITFAGSVEVPGEVIYLHPEHNLALVRYDVKRLGETPIRSARLRLDPLETGDEVWLVGLSSRQRFVTRKTRVARVEAPQLPLMNPPRFRETNIELIGLADTAATLGGVISDEKGGIYATWAAFSVSDEDGVKSQFAGIPARAIAEMLATARADGERSWRSLGVELLPLSLADARNRGLRPEVARRFEDNERSRRRVLGILRITAGTPAAEVLQVGDLLLAIDGDPVATFADVERAAQAERVRLTVLRDRREIDVDVETTPLDGRGTDRFLLWAGALLQAPHPAVAHQYGIDPEGVYVSWLWYGSPASRSDLLATDRIVEFDGTPVRDLDAFLAAVSALPDDRPVRFKSIDLDGKIAVVTLKPDFRFWPTVEIRRGEDGWERIEHGRGSAGAGANDDG